MAVFLKQLKQAGLASDQLRHFYLSAIRPILEYCSVAWNHGLTKAQVEQLEAVQRRSVRIISLRWHMRISHLYMHVGKT